MDCWISEMALDLLRRFEEIENQPDDEHSMDGVEILGYANCVYEELDKNGLIQRGKMLPGGARPFGLTPKGRRNLEAQQRRNRPSRTRT